MDFFARDIFVRGETESTSGEFRRGSPSIPLTAQLSRASLHCIIINKCPCLLMMFFSLRHDSPHPFLLIISPLAAGCAKIKEDRPPAEHTRQIRRLDTSDPELFCVTRIFLPLLCRRLLLVLLSSGRFFPTTFLVESYGVINAMSKLDSCRLRSTA